MGRWSFLVAAVAVTTLSFSTPSVSAIGVAEANSRRHLHGHSHRDDTKSDAEEEIIVPTQEIVPTGYILGGHSNSRGNVAESGNTAVVANVTDAPGVNYVRPLIESGNAKANSKIYNQLVGYKQVVSAIVDRKQDEVRSSVQNLEQQIRQEIYKRDELLSLLEQQALKANEQIRIFSHLKGKLEAENGKIASLQKSVSSVLSKYTQDSDADKDLLRNLKVLRMFVTVCTWSYLLFWQYVQVTMNVTGPEAPTHFVCRVRD